MSKWTTTLFILFSIQSVSLLASDTQIQWLDKHETVVFDRVELDQWGKMPSDLKMSVPGHTESIHIFIEGQNSDHFYLVEKLQNPQGQLVVTPSSRKKLNPTEFDGDLEYQLPFHSENRSLPVMPEVGSLLVPNNLTTKVTPGTWRFKVASFSDLELPPWKTQQVKVTVTFKVRKKQVAESLKRFRLPIRLYTTGARGWTKDNLKRTPEFKRMWQKLKRKFSSGKIDVVLESVHDVNALYQKVEFESGVGARPDITDLFSLEHQGEAINIVLVDEIKSQDANLLALTGSLPGPVAKGAQKGTSVVITLQRSMDANANLLAHEIGHYLGLFHTEELFGFLGDEDHDHEHGGALKDLDQLPSTGMSDTTNLMYPHVGHRHMEFTEDQIQVMLGHPLIRAYEIN